MGSGCVNPTSGALVSKSLNGAGGWTRRLGADGALALPEAEHESPPVVRRLQFDYPAFNLSTGALFGADASVSGVVGLPSMPYTSWTVASNGSISSTSVPVAVDVSAVARTVAGGSPVVPNGPTLPFDLAPGAALVATVFVPNATLEVDFFLASTASSCGAAAPAAASFSVAVATQAGVAPLLTLSAVPANVTGWRAGASGAWSSVWSAQQALANVGGAMYFVAITCTNPCARCTGYAAAEYVTPPVFKLQANWTVGFSTQLAVGGLPAGASSTPEFAAALGSATAAAAGLPYDLINATVTTSTSGNATVSLTAGFLVVAQGNLTAGDTSTLTTAGRDSHSDACANGMDVAFGASNVLASTVGGAGAANEASRGVQPLFIDCSTVTSPVLYARVCDPTYTAGGRVMDYTPINASNAALVPVSFAGVLAAVSDVYASSGLRRILGAALSAADLSPNATSGAMGFTSSLSTSPIAFMTLVSASVLVVQGGAAPSAPAATPTSSPATLAASIDFNRQSNVDAIVGGVIGGAAVLALIACVATRKHARARGGAPSLKGADAAPSAAQEPAQGSVPPAVTVRDPAAGTPNSAAPTAPASTDSARVLVTVTGGRGTGAAAADDATEVLPPGSVTTDQATDV